MNNLDRAKWDYVTGGGAAPQVECGAPSTSIARSGNIEVTTQTQVCQVAGGLTQTNRTSITVTHADMGISAVVKRFVNGEVAVDRVETKTETVTCTPKGECKTSDLGDGSAFEGFANIGSDGWGDNADWGDGGAWAGGDGMGGGSGGILSDEYEVAVC